MDNRLIISTLPTGQSAFGSTLRQLRDKVYAGLRDDTRQFIQPWQVDELLNEGYLDLCARLRLNRVEATGTVDGSGKIALPTGFIELGSLQIGEVDLQEVTDAVYDSYRIPGDEPGVTMYRFFGASIETYPSTAGSSYTLRYIAIPTRLSQDIDVFSSLPPELEVRLVSYARAHCRWTEGDFNEGDRYMSIYVSGLPDYPRAAFRQGKGPSSLTPAPSVFDESDE